MALDASRILCMSQYNKSDIYALLDEGTQYRLVSFTSSQGSPEASFRTIGTATKQSLVEIRRPLDCYGRSTISSFVAIMPGTKDVYPNPTLNGIRIDFGNNGLFWSPINVNAVYTEATAPTTSVLQTTKEERALLDTSTVVGSAIIVDQVDGISQKKYRINFLSVAGSGTLGAGHVDIQDLPVEVISWKQFLIHENSFRNAAFATLVGDYTPGAYA
ncbi:hypothetical protein BGZ81_008721 [Podila clonocystis]|nr:hypothetical protein BGZ81_008721 [Podila clonocystis]